MRGDAGGGAPARGGAVGPGSSWRSSLRSLETTEPNPQGLEREVGLEKWAPVVLAFPPGQLSVGSGACLRSEVLVGLAEA
jgi:hypothetical protein